MQRTILFTLILCGLAACTPDIRAQDEQPSKPRKDDTPEAKPLPPFESRKMATAFRDRRDFSIAYPADAKITEGDLKPVAAALKKTLRYEPPTDMDKATLRKGEWRLSIGYDLSKLDKKRTAYGIVKKLTVKSADAQSTVYEAEFLRGGKEIRADLATGILEYEKAIRGPNVLLQAAWKDDVLTVTVEQPLLQGVIEKK